MECTEELREDRPTVVVEPVSKRSRKKLKDTCRKEEGHQEAMNGFKSGTKITTGNARGNLSKTET